MFLGLENVLNYIIIFFCNIHAGNFLNILSLTDCSFFFQVSILA